MAIKVRPEGHSSGGERGGSGCATGVGLMNGARRNALDMDMAHGHEHACRGTHKYQRQIDEARKVCKAGVRNRGGKEGEKTNVLAGELWPTGEGCSHETLQTAKVEREEKEQ